MNYTSVIFDLDGTLLNTLEDISDSANFMLSQFGFPQHDLQTYKYFVGEGINKLVLRALPQKKLDKKFVIYCTNLMREEYSRRWNAKTRLYPQIPDLLDFLTQLKLNMAILSNKPNDLTKKMATFFLRKWQFSIIQGEKPHVPKKPDPSAALSIAKRLKLLPSTFLFLGDSEVDMKTALAAGMYPVGVLWGFRTAEELRKNGANILIENKDDLKRIIIH